MSRATDTLIALNSIENRVEKSRVFDANGDPMENAERVVLINDLNDASGHTKITGYWAKLLVQEAPASSGTRYKGLVPGSEANDIVNGKLYVKTSAVGATDAWAVAGTQT